MASPHDAPPRVRKVLSLAAVVALAAAAIVGLAQLGLHAAVFAGRAAFPLDLEWMEGGVLHHARRLADGEGIYVAPSVDFIPFLYTPLYPALLALLSKVVPLGYVLGRLVSLLAFTGALALTVACAAREAWGGARVVAVACGVAVAGAIVAGFTFTGTFHDLVRADSLLLLLATLSLWLALRGRGWRSAALAGVIIALGFFAKQTASILGVAIGLGLLVSSWRRGVVYGLAAAGVLGAGFLVLRGTSGGWFWTYVFELHQSHDFRSHLAWVETPARLVGYAGALYLALILATIALAIGGRLRRSDAIPWLAAIGGVLSACVGFGTQWAFDNAFIPAVAFPALALGVMAARLLTHARGTGRPGALLCAAAVCAALALHGVRAGAPDRARLVPGVADHAAAARFLDRLRALDGEVFIPFHPYYAVLVGKRPYVHRMGVLDVGARLGRPAGLDEAIASQRFPHIVLDWKSQPGEWPHLDQRYRVVHQFADGVDAVRSFSGAETSPRWHFVPTRHERELPPGAVVLADFESGRWDGWVTAGTAFGAVPAPAPPALYGARAADSGSSGVQATGTLLSPPLILDRPRLRLRVAGPAAPDLRVALLDGPQTAREARPPGGDGVIEWDVRDLLGRPVTLIVEDRSPTAAIAIDNVAAY